MTVSDDDIGVLCRCLWASGGGARGSKAQQKRLVKLGLAVQKGLNVQSINEDIKGARLNITEAGKRFLQTGKLEAIS